LEDAAEMDEFRESAGGTGREAGDGSEVVVGGVEEVRDLATMVDHFALR
jgi:hypothetical protein